MPPFASARTSAWGEVIEVGRGLPPDVDYSLMRKNFKIRRIGVLVIGSVMSLTAVAGAQTADELNNDGKNPGNVTTQSMGFDRKSYSPLKQIDKSNVKKLVPVWNAAMMNDQGELAAPTIYNGVMYAFNGKWTFAIDVETGRQIWRTPVKLEAGIKRTPYHRGAATI